MPPFADNRPRCPSCRHVMRLRADDPSYSQQVNHCTQCGARLPFPELVQGAYPEDDLRAIALRLAAGQVTVSDAQTLARAWLRWME